MVTALGERVAPWPRLCRESTDAPPAATEVPATGPWTRRQRAAAPRLLATRQPSMAWVPLPHRNQHRCDRSRRPHAAALRQRRLRRCRESSAPLLRLEPAPAEVLATIASTGARATNTIRRIVHAKPVRSVTKWTRTVTRTRGPWLGCVVPAHRCRPLPHAGRTTAGACAGQRPPHVRGTGQAASNTSRHWRARPKTVPKVLLLVPRCHSTTQRALAEDGMGGACVISRVAAA